MRLLSELVDLVLPAGCICCQRPGMLWCPLCQPPSAPRLVESTGAAAERVGIAERVGAAERVGITPPPPPTYAAGSYAEELRTALLSYKERGHRQLAAPLAGYLADAVDCASRSLSAGHPAVVPAAGPLLVPIPSSRGAARTRGGDHMLRLARAVSRQTGLTLAPLLRLNGRIADSAGLGAAERSRNLAGRMTARPPGAGSPEPAAGWPGVLLLDDIVTTGATLGEARRALRDAGWPVAGAAVVAATRLRWLSGGPPSDGSAGTAQAPEAAGMPDRL